MTVWLLVGAVTSVALVYGVITLYVAELFTRSHRRRVEGTPEVYGLKFEDVQLLVSDGVILRGWFLDSPGARATVILIHDSNGTRADPEIGLLSLQSDYVRRGFNVFAFDLRGRGESSATRNYLGSTEQRDVAVAMAYVRGRVIGLPLILHGFGLGGSLAISTVGAGAHADAVIADSPASSAREQLQFRWHHIPNWLFTSACWLACRIYHADVNALVPQRAINDVGATPVLLVHGTADSEVPVTQTLNMVASTLNEGVETWIVDGGEHCRTYLDDPDRYLARCLVFIDEAVPRRVFVTAAG
jgi:alpha-beta hydrolase superfamily lysophospholipase